jgi:hypothetical protein
VAEGAAVAVVVGDAGSWVTAPLPPWSFVVFSGSRGGDEAGVTVAEVGAVVTVISSLNGSRLRAPSPAGAGGGDTVRLLAPLADDAVADEVAPGCVVRAAALLLPARCQKARAFSRARSSISDAARRGPVDWVTCGDALRPPKALPTLSVWLGWPTEV